VETVGAEIYGREGICCGGNFIHAQGLLHCHTETRTRGHSSSVPGIRPPGRQNTKAGTEIALTLST
jgi:hypothetical protein